MDKNEGSVRADVLLLKLNLVKSRTHAKDLIQAKKIYYKMGNEEFLLTKSSMVFPKNQIPQFIIHSIDEDGFDFSLYVSRGALKLKSILDILACDFQDKIVADVGASTGGFSDYLLKGERGVPQMIFAIDVGHGQLHPSLKNVHNLISFEGLNIKDGPNEELQNSDVWKKFGGVDFVIADLSFISLDKVLHGLCKLCKNEGHFILLFKPQFEVGKGNLSKNGIVKNSTAILESLEKYPNIFFHHRLLFLEFLPSKIVGKDGNQEYFFFLKKTETLDELLHEDAIKKFLKQIQQIEKNYGVNN